MRRCVVAVVCVLALAGCGGSKGGSRRQAASGATSGTGTSTTTSGSTTGTGTGAGTGAGTPGAAAPSRFLYSANYGDASITALRIDPATGAPAPFATTVLSDVPLRLAVDPTERFLYAIERGEVTALAIGTTGALTPIGAPVVLTGDYPMAGVVTPDGDFLVTTWYGGGVGACVRTFAIGPTGALTQAARLSLGSSAQPVDVVVGPNRVAYVVDEIAFTITPLSITPGTGALTPLGAPVSCPDARALALDATGTFLVAMTSASPGSVRSFRVGATGGLTPAGAPLGTGPHSPMAISRAPGGELYVVTASSSLIVVAVDAATGALTEQSVTSVPAHGFPCALAIDASGRFVYTANFAGDDLSILTVGPGGVTAGSNVAIAPAPGGAASGSTQPSFLVSVR